MTASAESPRFGSVLRRYRVAAGLSQEALAERAGLSARGVSNLERGISRVPYPSTLGRLADALGLVGSERADLAGYGREQGRISEPSPTDEQTQFGPLIPLPRELNGFVGRGRELAETERLLTESPLLTLAGPGGAGKTRLALHLANDLITRVDNPYADGVVLVELASIVDPALVVRLVSGAFGVAEERGKPLVESLPRVLRDRRVLLILDNCEHLIEATAALAETLINACRNLRILATSREPLAIAGEVVYRVQPLGLPKRDDIEALANSDAVHLFVLRARAVRSDFVLDQGNGAAVSEICRRLDGLPLAIELAAAWAAVLAPADIASRLDHSVQAQITVSRTTQPRQRTLDAAVAWSYDLLSAGERSLFDRLTVFSGGFTLAGADAMAYTDGDDGALGVLARLVARSMVQVEQQQDGSARYRLLEPLRQFGQARLIQRGELEMARRRQAEHVLVVAEEASPRLRGPDMLASFRRLEIEADNIRTAHDWAVESGAAELALRLCWALWWWWSRPDRQAEGRQRFDQALGVSGVVVSTAARGRVLAGLAFLALSQSDLSAAELTVDAALDAGRSTDDAWLHGLALLVLGMLRLFQGDVARAETALQQSEGCARDAGLTWLEARAREARGHVALACSDLALAEAQFSASLRMAREHLDLWSQAMSLQGLADVLRSRGDAEGAGQLYDEALQMLRAIDGRGRAAAGPLHNLGYVALGRGNLRDAARLFRESAALYQAVGSDLRGLAECIMGLAGVAVASKEPELAARLFGAAESGLEQLGSTWTASNRADVDRSLASLKSALDSDRLDEAWAAGREWSLGEALEHATRLAAPGESLAVESDVVSRSDPNATGGGGATRAGQHGGTRRTRRRSSR